jgi:hypothetical protein
MEKSVERLCHGKVLRRVARLLARLGFERAKTTFFVRRQQWVIEFAHMHKYSFAPGYRVHLGIRVLNDVFPAVALNGPESHPYTCAESPNGSHYALDIGPDDASIDKCSSEIVRWCSDVCLPWFDQFHDPHALLMDRASPLGESEKAYLRLEMEGQSDPDSVRASESLFGTTEP